MTSVVTSRLARSSYTRIHHSSNLGPGKSGAWTGPAASLLSRLSRVSVTVSEAKSPSATSSSSDTPTSQESFTRGACRQKASMSKRCSLLNPSSFRSAGSRPPASTTSRNEGVFLGTLDTCGNCSSGDASISRACTKARSKRIRPLTTSKWLEPGCPCAAIDIAARITRTERRSTMSTLAFTAGLMCRWRPHMWAQISAAQRRIGGSLKGQGTSGSATAMATRAKVSTSGSSWGWTSDGVAGRSSTSQRAPPGAICRMTPRRPW
mmetsp:Transcript_41531/g.129424  ORF Transcript_41531/g.129424 Transcript_41531/m.129424 type:complete len:264 (-) Transcript_41531:54-845(-)